MRKRKGKWLDRHGVLWLALAIAIPAMASGQIPGSWVAQQLESESVDLDPEALGTPRLLAVCDAARCATGLLDSDPAKATRQPTSQAGARSPPIS